MTRGIRIDVVNNIPSTQLTPSGLDGSIGILIIVFIYLDYSTCILILECVYLL